MCRSNPWVRKIPWSRKWKPTPVFLPRKFHGQMSLAGYSPWGNKKKHQTQLRDKAHAHILTEKKQKNTFGELVPQLWADADSHATKTILNFFPLREAFGKH